MESVAIAWSLVAALHLGNVQPAGSDEAPQPETAFIQDADADRWWGIAGTIICGAGVRLMRVPGIGLNPWVLAPTVGGCLLGLIDAFTTETASPA